MPAPVSYTHLDVYKRQSIPFHSVWNIICGNGDEPVTWQNIIWKSRFPQALTALVAGAGLAISGLQMQTVFRNPLAGPSVLGLSLIHISFTMSIRFACGSFGSPGIRMISPMMTTIISAPLLMMISRTFSSKSLATP